MTAVRRTIRSRWKQMSGYPTYQASPARKAQQNALQEYNEHAMQEYLALRASETLGQAELVEFLESRFPAATRTIGQEVVPGTRCVETRVPVKSQAFQDIARLIASRRAEGQKAFDFFPVASYLRKYAKNELRDAELLNLDISAHFEPAGEECGTIYETLCQDCNMGRQSSELILDLRRAPQGKDMAQTIAWTEWIVSSKFARGFREQHLTGAEFRPIFEFTFPTRQSGDWQQLWITGKAGRLSEKTRPGKDPFSPSQTKWCCPRGHSVVTTFLSEIFLRREEWDGSDIAVTDNLFGQGRNLLRPTPLIIISALLYSLLKEQHFRGFSCEIVRLV